MIQYIIHFYRYIKNVFTGRHRQVVPYNDNINTINVASRLYFDEINRNIPIHNNYIRNNIESDIIRSYITSYPTHNYVYNNTTPRENISSRSVRSTYTTPNNIILKKFPIITTSNLNYYNILKHKKCAICLSKYKKKNNIIILKCLHLYHVNCIDKWFNTNTSCPTCRKKYTLSDNINKKKILKLWYNKIK